MATMDVPQKGGFSFDLCRRNEMLVSKGLRSPSFLKTGTTIVGLIFKNFLCEANPLSHQPCEAFQICWCQTFSDILPDPCSLPLLYTVFLLVDLLTGKISSKAQNGPCLSTLQICSAAGLGEVEARARKDGGKSFHIASGGRCGEREIADVLKISPIPFIELNGTVLSPAYLNAEECNITSFF
ncbi:hypothetical protein H5410_026324 [Solanum commersonii]|uniref:Uncharacterized protein n=1 Tax=Solanum commersonii TaxID=4109 RepID=A0A9J5YYG6_SOLCO|nr:hypothetical protein H5410_026324 [Solanum commersonii]